MRINKIKLSGFKSFVDPTTLEFPGNLTGVVGPNGCGKSNIIDAMLWVLGESSAKHLRGDSMADVVFNGSNTRKPVGQAAVEIVFDNSDGKIGGQYAAYNEISIKRQVGRDGVSSYFLNGARCRRRDITNIFLGTGIGSRSYSVIEQGMISRVIEAKPEELRMFLEEAAGISKYKERRRETENRIRNAKENISRISDIIAELDKQLQTLNRQARAAQKYQQYRQEERATHAQLYTLRWRAVRAQSERQVQLTEQSANAVEATSAALHAAEAEMTRQREGQIAASDRFNEVQSAYYNVGSELARSEQAIRHTQERRQAMEQELAQTERNLDEARRHVEDDERRLRMLGEECEGLAPLQSSLQGDEARAQAEVNAAEQDMQDWQGRWDEHHRSGAETSRSEHVERTRLEHLEQGLADARRRIATLNTERDSLLPEAIRQAIGDLQQRIDIAEASHNEISAQQDTVQAAMRERRELIHRLSTDLDALRQQRQVLRGRVASLEALQQSAMGMDRPAVHAWLEKFGFTGTARLASAITVDAGWEQAVETVVKIPLESLCVEHLEPVMSGLGDLAEGTISAVAVTRATPLEEDPPSLPVPTLAAKVRSSVPFGDFLSGIYAVESLEEARQIESRLQAHQSVVTRDGIWLGPGWVYSRREQGPQGGILARTRELKRLTAQSAEIEAQVEAIDRRIEEGRTRLAQLEQEDAELRARLAASHRDLASLRSELAANAARLEQVVNRLARIDAESGELEDQIALDEEEAETSRARLETLRERSAGFAVEREELLARREGLRNGLQQARESWRSVRDRGHEVALKLGALNSERAGIEQALSRNRSLIERLDRRCAELRDNLAGVHAPIEQLQAQREQLLGQRLRVEGDLAQARAAVQAADGALRELDQRRLTVERELAARRDELEQARVEARALEVRLQNLREQIEVEDTKLDEVLANLPPDATEPQWEERLAEIGRKVQRLGPINLAAIDEFNTLSERKTYLDRQFADLNEALATLGEAIRKIDRETRTRFRETFDKVNTGLQALFPILFGGGHAYLELTGEDLLETGVTVMARPPGKRNSTIHLLSGGEKALTAVSLVFAIFDLKPAPFCLLDEVDAPLDDANIVRLCDMLKKKSQDIQFLFITHNKITMEIAQQLIGVTMHEAGVSRLVAVNMEEAVRLAATA